MINRSASGNSHDLARRSLLRIGGATVAGTSMLALLSGPPAAAAQMPALNELLSSTSGVRLEPIRGVGDRFRTLTILLYHSVNMNSFRIDLDFYQEWNYSTVTMGDVWEHLLGISTLPDKPLIISFDDGLPTQYAAAQELNSRGMTGTLFVATGWIDGLISQTAAGFAEPTPLTWDQIRQMKAWGVDIQSHTVSHQDQTTLTATQVASEFTGSKARIEAQVTGQRVSHLAYPYGAWNLAVKAALRGAGCLMARAVRLAGDGEFPGRNRGRLMLATTSHDPLALPVAGTGNGDVQQPNYFRSLGADPEYVPDFGFEGGAKGWSLGTGFAVDTSEKFSGTRSLRCTQGTSTVSSRPLRGIPVGRWCRLQIRGAIKTSGLPAGTQTRVSLQILRADASIIATTDVVLVTGNNGTWAEFVHEYVGGAADSEVLLYLSLQGNGAPAGGAWWDALSIKRENLPPSMA